MNRRIVILIFSVVFLNTNLYSQSYSIDTIQYNGDPNKLINFVVIGDGYQVNQLNTYITDAVNLSNYIFSISPFLEYKDYFNVFAINVPSIDSGANHPGTSPDASCSSVPFSSVNTCCNSTFDYANIHRLLVPQNYTAINNILINNFPLYDQKIILVNSPYYGGSGGSNATTSLHPLAPDILVHEIGHSFSGLADEYWAGDQYAAEKPNLTQETNPLLVKWKNWIGTNGIGIYQHSGTTIASTWYRPHNNCMMRNYGPFCSVCKETIIEEIHNIVGSPILISYPSQNNIVYTNPVQFKLTLLKPIPNTLRVRWNLNGFQIANNIDSITLISSNLITGANVLSAEVIDTTQSSRYDDHPIYHTYNVSWVIQYSTANSWDCDGQGNCTDPGTGNGQYSSLSSCQSNCIVPSWNCDGQGNCTDPGTGNGQYSSLSSCQSNCIVPSWNCDEQGNCYDPGTGLGMYLDLPTCETACINVSVNEIGLDNFKIYPNPSSDIFNIEFTSKAKQGIKIKVTNLIGETIFTEDLIEFKGRYTYSFNLEPYSKGNYLLQINTDKGIVNKKLILE